MIKMCRRSETVLYAVMATATAGAADLARLPGVAVVADSQNRDRWGLDGYHPALVRDGNAAGVGVGARTAAWASDNWEVTHTLALVFPVRVKVREIAIHWARPRDAWLTPTGYALHGLVEDGWRELARVEDATPAARSAHEVGPAALDALRVVMLPGGAHPGADRRLWIAELEVRGEPEQPERRVDVEAVSERIRGELREQRRREDEARTAPLLAVAMQRRKPRGFMSIIDRDDLARGRLNAASRKWAAAYATKVKKDADWWVAQTDEYVHGLVPEGNPRALCPQFEKGCPIHGGARRSFEATLEQPYRWRCREGGEWWYDGAVVQNPTTGASVTVRDQGAGWVAPSGFPHPGRRYFFVPAYRYFLLGKLFSGPYEPDGGSEYRGGTPVVQLAVAYALTGDGRYAHKCAVMLNRLAELYPTYDGCIESPTQRQDGYIGQTFERFLVQNLILACDLIWDTIETDEELHALFAAKGDADYDGDGRTTGADFTYNLQRNLLGRIYEYLHRLMPYMDGDFLMYEMTALAALAHCLGNADIAAEAMESDLGLRVMLTNSWFRDGKFIYDASGYNVGNARTPLAIAEWLHGFSAPPRRPGPVDLYHHPEYRMSMLFDFLRRIDCDGRVPQIGDCNGPRSCRLSVKPAYDRYDERALLRLPEQSEFYSRRLNAAAGGRLEEFRDGRTDWWLVFHAGPARETSAAAPAAAAQPPSHLFPDSGIAVLRGGRDARTRQHVCLTFSKGGYGHGHTDKLAINLLRYGYDLSADLGYPTTWTDIKYGGWERNTASHCTVMLDEKPQRGNVIGRLHHYAPQTAFDVVEASAQPAYPQASLYRRTVALVRDQAGEPLYTVDVFRTAGAATRDYLFHSLGGPEDLEVVSHGPELSWAAQGRGSLAGEDVEPMTRGGYGFLFDVRRAQTDGQVTARWMSRSGQSQTDRYLLTRRKLRDFVVEFVMTRTGAASGKRERACFVFGVDPFNQKHRRVAWLDAGGRLPVGKPVRVRIEVSGKEARVFFDGKLSNRGVDVSGEPLDAGVAGFLHYYNYAYDYRDLVVTPAEGAPLAADFSKPLDQGFWGKVDPTYCSSGGVLRVRDTEQVGLDLHLLGAPGRELIRAKAEGYGVRGDSPLEAHFIARERAADPARASAFTAVLEAHRGAPRVVAVAATPVVTAPDVEGADPGPGGAGPVAGAAVGVRVTTAEGVDYVVSALDGGAECAATLDGVRVLFRGRFGFVRTRAGEVAGLGLVGDGFIECNGRRLESPGDVRGRVTAVDLAGDAITIELDPGSAAPSSAAVGRHVLVRNAAFVCPGVYGIRGVEQTGPGEWRLGLGMPLLVARGVVRSVDAAGGRFASRTPVMKLRVNPGLFNGKRVAAPGAPGAGVHLLKTATEAAFVLADPGAIRDFKAGGEYVVYDLGVGDRVEIVAQAEKTF